MSKNSVDKDYWALRSWGICAKTALKMVGKAYTDNEH